MKRDAQQQAYYDESKRTIAERARGGCEIAVEGVCTGRGSMAHHVVRQGQGGTDDPGNLLWVDLKCHDYVHRNVAWAKANGFIKSSWTPVRTKSAVALRPVPATESEGSHVPDDEARATAVPFARRSLSLGANAGRSAPSSPDTVAAHTIAT